MAGVDGRDAAAQAVADDPSGDLGDPLRGEAEVLEYGRPGSTRPEVVDADDRALVAHVALPAERDPGLDAQPLPDPRREDLVAVGGRLEVEQLPARQRHDPRPDALGGERIGGRDGQRQLRPRREEDQLDRLWAAARLADDVAAPGDAVAGPGGGLGQRRELLTGQGEGDGAVGARHGHGPGGRRLVCVAGPDEPQVGDRPEARVVLDGLVGRAVLAEPDRSWVQT